MSSGTAKAGMFIGLIVSGFILLAVVGVVLYFMLGGTAINAPTKITTDPGAMDEIVLDIDPSGMLKMPDASGGGAEGAYADAFKLAEAQGLGFVEFAKKEREPMQNPGYKPIVDKLIEASNMGMGAGTELNFESIESVSPITEFGIRDRLAAMATLLEKAGMSYRADKNREEAEKCFRADFVFGYRLWHNGTFVPYKSAGLAAMSGATANFRSNYSKDWFNDPAKADKAAEISMSLKDVGLKWEAKKKDVAPHRNPNNMEPGDLYNIAENDKDRAWRLEGIVWLGAVQWTNPRGSRDGIHTYLQSKSGSSDPLAAQKAKEALQFVRTDVGRIPGG